MTSTVKFRMQQGSEFTAVKFNGPFIHLLELKRHIVEKKYGTVTSSDFDFNVTDTNGNKYTADDEQVPRDTSLIVKRVPVKNILGLLTRLKAPKPPPGRAHHANPNQSMHTRANEIYLPAQEEEEYVPLVKKEVKEAVTEEKEEDDGDGDGVDDEEAEAQINAALEKLQAQGPTGAAVHERGGPGQRGAFGANSGAFNRPQNTNTCGRCGEWGHRDKMCPTIGDPTYDPIETQRTSSLPQALKKTVESLDGLDLTNKTVTQNEDGTWDIVAAGGAGLKAIQRDSAAAFKEAEINMDEVPDSLKCPISNTLLKECIELPCCHKCVNDNIVRKKLLNDSEDMACPLCKKTNISLEHLMMRKDVRKSVDDYIVSKQKGNGSGSAGGNGDDAAVTENKTAEQVQAETTQAMMNPDNWGGYGGMMMGGPLGGIGSMGGMGMVGMQGMTPQLQQQQQQQQQMQMQMMMQQQMLMQQAAYGGGMIQQTPGAGAGVQGGFDPFNPPRERLPAPMSEEDFLYEQAMQLQEQARGEPRRRGGGAVDRRNRDERDRYDDDRDSGRNRKDQRRERSRSRDRDSDDYSLDSRESNYNRRGNHVDKRDRRRDNDRSYGNSRDRDRDCQRRGGGSNDNVGNRNRGRAAGGGGGGGGGRSRKRGGRR